VQSSLGAAATVAIAIPNGVLLPQASVAWLHDYANDARNVDARSVEAPNSPAFTFQRERPARDWVNIAIGAWASFANGMQPLVQFVTVQGNDNYVSYGGTAGLRYSFEQAPDDGAVDIFRGDEDQRWITDGGISGNLERTGRRTGSCRRARDRSAGAARDRLRRSGGLADPRHRPRMSRRGAVLTIGGRS
jgi:hypothetical protein